MSFLQATPQHSYPGTVPPHADKIPVVSIVPKRQNSSPELATRHNWPPGFEFMGLRIHGSGSVRNIWGSGTLPFQGELREQTIEFIMSSSISPSLTLNRSNPYERFYFSTKTYGIAVLWIRNDFVRIRYYYSGSGSDLTKKVPDPQHREKIKRHPPYRKLRTP